MAGTVRFCEAKDQQASVATLSSTTCCNLENYAQRSKQLFPNVRLDPWVKLHASQRERLRHPAGILKFLGRAFPGIKKPLWTVSVHRGADRDSSVPSCLLDWRRV